MTEQASHAIAATSPLQSSADPSGSNLRAVPDTSSGATPPWEDYFPTLPLDAQQRLVRLAQEQRGHLLADQLPPPAAPIGADRFRTFAKHILESAGPDTLTPLPFLQPLTPFDDQLDTTQRDVVQQALHCPDLFLVQALPGTGRTRVAVELIRQAIHRGWRVLLVSSRPSSVDRVLARLNDPQAVPVRMLASEEKVSDLPETMVRITSTTQQNALLQYVTSCARERCELAEARFESLSQLENLLQQYLSASERRAQQRLECERLQTKYAAVEQEVRSEVARLDQDSSEPLAVVLREIRTTYETSRRQILAEWEEVSQACRAQSVEVEAAKKALETLQTQQESRDHGSWWSMKHWKASWDKTLPERLQHAREQLAKREADLAALSRREAELQRDEQAARAEFETRTEAVIAGEVTRRRQEIQKQIEAIESDRSHDQPLPVDLVERFQQVGCPAPADLSSASLQLSLKHLAAARAQQELCVREARNWPEIVEREKESLLARWRHSVNLLAGPLAALNADPWFKDPVSRQTVFDLLILLDAHLLSEAEFLPATRRSNRWVLIGEPPLPVLRSSHRPRSMHGRPAVRPRTLPDFFHRLWDSLRLTRWSREGDRLICHRQRVSLAERAALDREPLANRPEIELRISVRPDGSSTLAEVAFPADMSVRDAKQFMLEELGELHVVLRCRSITWHETDDEWHCWFGPKAPMYRLAIDHEITELLCDCGTVGFAFRKDAGWSPERGLAWLEANIRSGDSGRTADLQIPYHQTPELASWMNDVLFGRNGYDVARPANVPVDFVAVPTMESLPARDLRSAGSDRASTRGAGLEVDLEDPIQRGHLTPELASVLPMEGFINPLEVDAIAGLLPSLQDSGSILITAPYDSQVALLRHELQLHLPPNARIVSFSELGQTACETLIVSLTRSHLSRAVTYGRDPLTLLSGLLRARRRIVFVGDPGTLSRRALWDGAIDHLDEVSGERERCWVQALVRRLPARVIHPASPLVPEGANT